jgi:predicted 2-oxoglutarate/Fe(II)-dependent dioxygenase YbiX
MKKKLIDYVKHYKSYLNKDICNSTIKQLESLHIDKWNQHEFYDPSSDKFMNISGNQELSISYSNEILTKQIIMKEIWNIINKYIVHDLKFNWFDRWNGYTEVRFNKYSKNIKMAEHCDHIHSMFDGNTKGIPILSVLGILNDNYEGGEFIMFEDKEIKFKKGDILVFPSLFLYPHKVEPVKKGTRYSFISWVW